MAIPTAAATESNVLTQLDAGSKGVGMFATHAVARGSLLLAEAPLISMAQEGENQEHWDNCLMNKFNKLPEDASSKYYALKFDKEMISQEDVETIGDEISTVQSWTNDDKFQQAANAKSTIMAIFNTNCAAMGDDGEYGYGIFPDFSRINHSCVPNASWIYDNHSGKIQVYATINISQGEEVLISYVDLHGPYKYRADQLPFECECRVCEPSKRDASDTRRQRIKNIKDGLEAFLQGHAAPEPAVRPDNNFQAWEMAMEYVKLLMCEGLSGDPLTKGWEQLALYNIKNHGKDQAMRCIRLAEWNRQAITGVRAQCALWLFDTFEACCRGESDT
ncbi:SET domain-containing protein [Xylariaceae sp. AK1471]|nr:SET domain-containing protein [Xylariaceae sp. AK1471]